MAIVTVPPCTEYCRLVCVIGVLIFSYTRTCVAFVLVAERVET